MNLDQSILEAIKKLKQADDAKAEAERKQAEADFEQHLASCKRIADVVEMAGVDPAEIHLPDFQMPVPTQPCVEFRVKRPEGIGSDVSSHYFLRVTQITENFVRFSWGNCTTIQEFVWESVPDGKLQLFTPENLKAQIARAVAEAIYEQMTDGIPF